MATEATAPSERPSGSYVSLRSDGFEIQSNVGTEDDLRAELGVTPLAPAPSAEGAEAATSPAAAGNADAEPVPLPSAAKPTGGRRGRQIQTAIEQELERKRVAKAEADAEEARLATLREEAKKLTTPAPAASQATQPVQPAPRQPAPPIAQPEPRQPAQPAVYDGSDPNDPEPTLEMFKDAPDPYTARIDARTEWASRKAERRAYRQFTLNEQLRQAEATYASRLNAYQSRIAEADKVAEDKEWKTKLDPEVLTALEFATPPTYDQQTGRWQEHWGTPLGNLVFDASNPKDFLVYFSSNKQEFQRLATLQPADQLLAFGELRERLRSAARPTTAPAAKPKPVSQAKPPAQSVAGTAQSAAADERSDDELSDDEHEARFAQLRRRFR